MGQTPEEYLLEAIKAYLCAAEAHPPRISSKDTDIYLSIRLKIPTELDDEGHVVKEDPGAAMTRYLLDLLWKYQDEQRKKT
jgi:hypothetical protein